MKVALLIDRETFNKYANWNDTGWELTFIDTRSYGLAEVTSTSADVLIIGPATVIVPELFENMPELKLIHSQAVAYHNIDLELARKAGVYVCNAAGTNADPVAEQTVLLMLALIKNFRNNEDNMYATQRSAGAPAYFGRGVRELKGLNVGIVGFGAIGRGVAARLEPFGCMLHYFDALGDQHVDNAKFLPLEELYACSDIISLHAPVTPETTNMINEKSLKLFKRGAILINTARGLLMDHDAVVEALKSGQLGGLGADTLEPEPVTPDNPIIRDLPEELRKNVALSPHVGGITDGAFIRAYECVKANIEAVAAGQRPKFIVNGL